MATPRRDFLGWLGAGGVMAATGGPLRTATPLRAATEGPVSDE